MKKRIISLVFGMVMTVASALTFMPVQAAMVRDCDSNAIMRCGAADVAELTSKTTGDVASIYGHYGIKKADFGSLVEGTVYKDGRVTVGSSVVANGAISTGRQVIGSNSKAVNAGGVRIYERPTSTSFRSASIPAFVKMTNGRFQYAIIKSCGNPTKATPTPTPPKPTPTPKIDIQKDVSKAIVEVGEQFTYTLRVKNTGPVDIQSGGVSDKAPANIEFIPGSGTKGTTVTKTEFKATIATLKKGATVTYTFKAKFTKYVAGNVKNTACVLASKPKPVGDCDTAENKPKKPPVKIEECKPGIPVGDERCNPEVPEVPEVPETPVTPITPVTVVTEVPKTGPAEVLGGAMGLSSTTYGVVSYLRSRRGLKNLFRK